MGDKQKFAFDKTNFILLAIGMAVVILGFILMTGPSSSETVFQADIFSVRKSGIYHCGACSHCVQYIGDSVERDRLDFPWFI